MRQPTRTHAALSLAAILLLAVTATAAAETD